METPPKHKYQANIVMEGNGYSATIIRDGEEDGHTTTQLSGGEAKREARNYMRRARRQDKEFNKIIPQ